MNMDTSSVTPNYSYIFNFENDFVHYKTRLWMIDNWTLVFYYSAAYIMVIFGVQHFMKNRPKYELKGLLILWNTALAMFSFMGFTRTAPELIHVLSNYGLYHSICVPTFIEQDRVSGFWTWLFVLSKLPELGDTIFIVLRKQPLIFLHWYHHITVLMYSWFSYSEYTASARWFIVMNYCVHSIMYSYYALKAAKFSPPRFIAMIITSLQLIQMIVGCTINIWARDFLQTHGRHACHISSTNIRVSLVMYFSYFILFARFFYKAYISSSSPSKRESHKKHIYDPSSSRIDSNKTKANFTNNLDATTGKVKAH